MPVNFTGLLELDVAVAPADILVAICEEIEGQVLEPVVYVAPGFICVLKFPEYGFWSVLTALPIKVSVVIGVTVCSLV